MEKIFLFCSLCFFTAVIAQTGKSIHYMENEYYSRGFRQIEIEKTSEQLFSKTSVVNLKKAVFGYLPWWEYSSGSYKNIKYNLLSHIALFSFEADSLGTLQDPPDWPWDEILFQNDSSGTLGPKLILTVTNFNSNHIHTLMTDSAAKQNLFYNIKDRLNRYRLNGVNINFENLLQDDKNSIVNHFMKELNEYLKSDNQLFEVSFASPAVGFGLWDFKSLADNCDYLFVMCYEYSGGWGDRTGPSSPLYGNVISVTRTIENEYKDVVLTDPGKLILGIPYCGNHWITDLDQPYTPVMPYDTSKSFNNWQGRILYRDVFPALEAKERVWDDSSQTPWRRWQDTTKTWHQVWYDDSVSLALKYDLAIQKDLKGIGIWALGYDGNREELWKLIEKKFANPTYVHKENQLPSSFVLYQNYPNPFNPETVISYQITPLNLTKGGTSVHVTLKVYDILGREITTLVNEEKLPGLYKVKFYASKLSTGIYFYTINAGNSTNGSDHVLMQTKKMLLIK